MQVVALVDCKGFGLGSGFSSLEKLASLLGIVRMQMLLSLCLVWRGESQAHTPQLSCEPESLVHNTSVSWDHVCVLVVKLCQGRLLIIDVKPVYACYKGRMVQMCRFRRITLHAA